MPRWPALLLAAWLAAPAAAQVQRWDLGDLYADAAAWERAVQQLRDRAELLDAAKEGLGRSAAALRDTLLAASDAQRERARLLAWALLQADANLRDPRAQERRQQAQALSALVAEKTAWIAPAVQALGAERVRALVAEDAVLRQRFDTFLEDTLRQAAHTLGPEAERLLATLQPVLEQPSALYQQMSDAELQLPRVRLSDGRRVQLSTPAFERLRTLPRRADRQRVFEAFFGAYRRAEGSFGANLTTEVMGNVFSARARRFGSAMESALFADEMPPQVLRTLVEQAHAGLPVLHRYLKLRQRLLGIRGPLGYHDNYPPLSPVPPGQRWTIERSQATLLAALAPLGDEYLALLRRGFAARWTDSHPRPGKVSGAYMAGAAYDVHPYLLLNHNDDFDSLSTYAHEWGHAVHTLLANAQPYDKSGYATVVAESASIGNEMLLLDHLVAGAATRDEKLYYLTQALETIRTTFFRQVMFAEFQIAMHDEVEQGRPLSGDRLSRLYCGIARRYYGQAEGVMRIAPVNCVEWAYVGHFYSGFYVWQYAAAIAGAAQLTDAVLREGVPARERFIALLKAGSSAPAHRLYRAAGVDLADAAPYRALVARMGRLLDEVERLAPR